MEDKEIKVEVSKASKDTYTKRLIKSVWKALPIFEMYGSDNLRVYVHGLLIDVCSADVLFDGEFSEIIVKLNSIYISGFEHKELKKKVRECIDILELKANASKV